METYIELIHKELSKRCRRNARYSQRAFAKSLGIHPATLTKILQGKKIPGKDVSHKLLQALDLSPLHQRKFIESLSRSSSLRRYGDNVPQIRILKENTLHDDAFQVISEWCHIALLELTYVKEFRDDPKWIARALEISVAEATLAWENLVRLNLVERKKGRWVKSSDFLSTVDKSVTGPAYRQRQRQVMQKAIASLEQDPLEQRSMTTVTMAIDIRKINEAKALISEFNRNLCALLESENRDRVYELTVGLFPVQKEVTP